MYLLTSNHTIWFAFSPYNSISKLLGDVSLSLFHRLYYSLEDYSLYFQLERTAILEFVWFEVRVGLMPLSNTDGLLMESSAGNCCCYTFTIFGGMSRKINI
ncbi:hypothetical protein KFK09_011886 [Dendrobium nobile]|uniref:Uncharacterized protein n=1 Tax=Dendrobium nobile TaxID=94219 RepID=A0A8T3BH60_DENNO|nr:hypothetical protein KFK09_011886 [Dendrobium nobile]